MRVRGGIGVAELAIDNYQFGYLNSSFGSVIYLFALRFDRSDAVSLYCSGRRRMSILEASARYPGLIDRNPCGLRSILDKAFACERAALNVDIHMTKYRLELHERDILQMVAGSHACKWLGQKIRVSVDRCLAYFEYGCLSLDGGRI